MIRPVTLNMGRHLRHCQDLHLYEVLATRHFDVIHCETDSRIHLARLMLDLLKEPKLVGGWSATTMVHDHHLLVFAASQVETVEAMQLLTEQRRPPMQTFQVVLKRLPLVRALQAAYLVDWRLQVHLKQRRPPMQTFYCQVGAALRVANSGLL